MFRIAVLSLLLSTSVLFAADASAEAKAAFDKAYEAGGTAIAEKKWPVAAAKFEEALKAIGDADHPSKPVATALLAKAREMAKKEEGLHVANELLRLKQWSEAEAAYKKAAEALGETDEIKKGIAAAQAGAQAEKTGTVAKSDPPKADPPKVEPPKAEPPKPEPAKTVEKTEPKSEKLEVPEPKTLNRDHWQKGAGSSCYWAGDRLYLEEGDEYYTKTLKGDFAASVLFEAQMDHRSRICIELRPTKDSGSKAKVIGWGSKDGSPPMLAVDKDVKARGDEQPKGKLVLSFVRSGSKIEFYCDGKLVGHTWDGKAGQPYTLWVSGKGIMDGARVVEKE